MANQKACKKCKSIFEGIQCPKCGSNEFADNFKGRVVIINPENSEIAQHLNLKEKGSFAIKTG